jgi:hypothetical protein
MDTNQLQKILNDRADAALKDLIKKATLQFPVRIGRVSLSTNCVDNLKFVLNKNQVDINYLLEVLTEASFESAKHQFRERATKEFLQCVETTALELDEIRSQISN